MKTNFYLVILISLISHNLFGQNKIEASKLKEDFTILKKVYQEFHPGIYKYKSKDEIDNAFAICEKKLSNDLTLQETYVAINEFTASIQCGHSYPNFFNQKEKVVNQLFHNPTSLPFYFRFAEDKMFIIKSSDLQLKAGDIISKINGKSIKEITDKLIPIVRADGANNAKRLKLLEVNGSNKFEYFDVFFPFYFPLNKDSFFLEISNMYGDSLKVVSVKSVMNTVRDSILTNGNKQTSIVYSWKNDSTAILTLNDFVNWNNEFDFFGYFKKCAQDYKNRKGKYLIIDARKLEGGSSSIGDSLLSYLIYKPLKIRNEQSIWAYVSIDSTIEKYIDNKDWGSENMYRNNNDFVKLSNGLYREKKAEGERTILPNNLTFRGKRFLLTSSENSSAGFTLTKTIKEEKLATLVGQTTGGNLKGITGGAYFFIVLPNSLIEVDVPLKGYDLDLVKNLPNAGIDPDIKTETKLIDLLKNIDRDMIEVEKLMRK